MINVLLLFCFIGLSVAFVPIPNCYSNNKNEESTRAGSYLVVGPNTIRPGQILRVSVTLTKQSADITVGICDSSLKTLISKTARGVQKNVPQLVEVGQIPASFSTTEAYSLCLKGTFDGIPVFEDFQKIKFDPKSISVFIQTDKAVYKPGKTVNFRVIVTDINLKPFAGDVGISIVDANKNILKQWNDVKLELGVATKSLDLSEEPVLGDWKIVVKVDDTGAEKVFSVDKYVLPRFEVELELPDHVQNDDDVSLTINSQYTYGKGTKGSAVVTARSVHGRRMQIKKHIQLDEDGTTDVKFTNTELKLRNMIIVGQSKNTILFSVVVTEELTKIVRNATAELDIYRMKYKLKIHTANNYFKPGLETKFLVALTTQDDSPLTSSADVIRMISVKIVQDDVKEPLLSKNIRLDVDGTKLITFQVPKNTTKFTIKVSNGATDALALKDELAMTSQTSKNNAYIQITKISNEIKIGSNAVFQIEVTNPVGQLFYYVVSKGDVVSSGIWDMNGLKIINSLKVTKAMTPRSRLIVYDTTGEEDDLIADAVNFDIAGDLGNKISLAMNTDSIEPFDENGIKNQVKIMIETQPESFVGILGVDQSVLLLKSGNDITRDMIVGELDQYDATKGEILPHFPSKTSASGTYEIFENSGVLVLTDANWEPGCRIDTYPDYEDFRFRGGMLEVAGGIAPQPNMANVFAVKTTADLAPRRPSSVKPKPRSKKVTIRTKFPETWLWLNLKSGSNGQIIYVADVPDTITSWITTGFSINQADGLAVVDDSYKLTVFRPFFITLNLPYSVKRGEQLAVQLIVFNYDTTTQEVTVELEYNPDTSRFNFVPKPKSKGTESTKPINQRQISVPGGGGSKSLFFPIIATEIGDISLKFRAVGSTATDGLLRKLKVEPEGTPVHVNRPILIDMTKARTFEKTVELEILPSNFVEGSVFAEFSLIGDMMGSVLNNLDSLLRMPTGCGEQNMIGLVPNIVVMKYLTAVNRLSQKVKRTATKFMEIGYQRELQYQHKRDHSFSAFGDRDPHGSTWLTAFVIRSFKQAEEFIFVDNNIIQKATTFLLTQQKRTGEFEENGNIIHKDMQGKVANSKVALTAYVLQALLQNDIQNSAAKNFLEENLNSIKSEPYALAITTYVMQLANSSRKSDALAMLEKFAIFNGEQTHWGKPQQSDVIRPTHHGPQPANVEMSAYALLTYVYMGETTKALPIVRWLLDQRNDRGGFGSTQDTIIGIQALAAYAERTFGDNLAVDVTVEEGDRKTDLALGSDNAIVLQKVVLKSVSQPIKITASGSGLGYGQFSYKYHVESMDEDKDFNCSKQVSKTDIHGQIGVSVCCRYTGESDESNMALIQFDTLSGYTIVKEDLELLPDQLSNLQRVEATDSDTKAAIYFNSLTKENTCITVNQQLDYVVADQKNAFIKIFDYYEPEKQVQLQYNFESTGSIEENCPDCFNE